MTIALHDRNKYRNTLKVHIITREAWEAMTAAAESKVPRGANEAQRLGYIRFFRLQLIFEDLKDPKKGNFTFDGPFPKEPVDHWRNYDETGEWYEVKYTQGEMAPIR